MAKVGKGILPFLADQALAGLDYHPVALADAPVDADHHHTRRVDTRADMSARASAACPRAETLASTRMRSARLPGDSDPTHGSSLSRRAAPKVQSARSACCDSGTKPDSTDSPAGQIISSPSSRGGLTSSR